VKILTINIDKKEYRSKHIKDLKISNPKWGTEHLNFLRENYKNTKYFLEIFPFVEEVLEKQTDSLIEVLYDSMMLSLKLLDINCQVIRMSDIHYDKEKQKSDLILELLIKTNADVYLSGSGAKEYMNMEDFQKNNVEVHFQNFSHPQYQQINSKEFVSGLSSLDLLFNEGIQNSSQIVKNML
ncbi:MAG: WbqC family protein, partial [Bacteroidota bacterium]